MQCSVTCAKLNPYFLQFWKFANSCLGRCNSSGSACHAGLADVDQNANISSDAAFLVLILEVL